MTQDRQVNRRRFLQTASAATGLLLVQPGVAFGYQANEKLRLGVIGCGGRGSWIGYLFQENTNTQVVALHDYFQEQADNAQQKMGLKEVRKYIGLDGYKEMLADGGLDAIAVESPPYFHPEQAVAGLEAGVHVYLAKPIAVDVPGCMAIVDAAEKNKDKLTCLVDFQTRNNEFYRGVAQRIHDGEIGFPVCGQAYYHASRLNIQMPPGTEVARLRNWVFDITLSGDIIVEQNIHVLDVANWYLQGHPVEATGTGGRRVRTDVGDCWDHYVVTYRYPNDVLIDFASTQFTTGYDALCTRLFGSTGSVESFYGGDVWLKNREGGWEGGNTAKIYTEGAVNNMKDFHKSIVEGKPYNNALESAHSTMTSILGRTAARAQGKVTWDEMVAANVKLDPRLDLPADGPLVKRG
ncbi:MAG: Gfo/Idh/MocA family oxidoreductase [Candidatus Hydrogenedentes bacterium]|nr:Gfo/Idh/MocA family oxidoreductase [Candidatus Hydrogenedentota bacterium]